MNKPITISLSPNATPSYKKQVWKTLLQPSTWKDQTILKTAEEKLSSFFSGRHITLTSSGRQALYDALVATGIGQGDEVIIQAFTCIAVPAPILWTGATPVYADIEADTYNINPNQIEQLITPRTKAIVIQHTFGIPGPIEEIQALAKKHNLLLIEDCAHALGGTYNNHPLGTFGDIAITSFGRDKTISTIFGGAIITPHEHVHRKLQDLKAKRSLPPSSWVVQQLLHPLLFQFITATYFIGHLGKAFLVLLQRLHILSMAVELKEKDGEKPVHFSYQFSPALAALLIEQLQELPSFISHRQKIAEYYQQHIDQQSFQLPRVSQKGTSAWLRFPIQTASADALRSYAKQFQILLGDWYYAPLVPNKNMNTFLYKEGSCPVAEAVAKKVVNLPTHPLMNERDAARIGDVLTTYANSGN